MTTQSQTEVLKMALEALDQLTNAADTFSVSGVYFNEEVWAKKCLSDAYFAITTIEEALAQPEQKQNLKLMPREATPEMLKAMDECSTEGYDERLYEGHAGSVYMAAWDAFYGQHCYCGDITNLGVIHRDDGPCHYPEHTSEYKRGYADAMNWKVQNHLEHLQPKVRTGDCLLTGVCASEGHKIQPKEPEQEPVAWAMLHDNGDFIDAINPEEHARIEGDYKHALYTTPPQRTAAEGEDTRRAWVGLTKDQMLEILREIDPETQRLPIGFRMFADAIEAKLKEKNT